MKVDIVPHDPEWVAIAESEAQRWHKALGNALLEVHHIGSTAIPRLSAKPIVDLLPVIANGVDVESLRPAIHEMGYEWLGEFGLPRRRYCRRSSPTTGKRLVHAHCWPEGDSEIRRHLAFRDALRADPLAMGAYEARKRYCASLHMNNPEGYSECKSSWINTVEARALEKQRGKRA